MNGYTIPYADEVTAEIDLFRRTWEDLMRQRIRLENRAVDRVTGEVRSTFLENMAEIIGTSEASVKRKLDQLVKKHPMGDWLIEAKTAGPRVATVLAMIRHPHRFPGQQCSNGCRLLPTFTEGDPCPCFTTPEKDGTPEPCTGTIQAPRHGTGTRSLWHMAGMHPVADKEGRQRLARRQAGAQSTFNTRTKTALLMPQGITQQFFMQGSRYAEVYYAAKERLKAERPDLKDGWYDGTARVIAGKAWLGDLLQEWKRRVPLDGPVESDGGDERARAA